MAEQPPVVNPLREANRLARIKLNMTEDETLCKSRVETLLAVVRNSEAPSFQADVLLDCAVERERQHDKFGDQSHRSLGLWNMILGEEFGEAQREMCDLSFESDAINRDAIGLRLREELIQTMAVCAAIVEAGDRHGWGTWPDERGLTHER